MVNDLPNSSTLNIEFDFAAITYNLVTKQMATLNFEFDFFLAIT